MTIDTKALGVLAEIKIPTCYKFLLEPAQYKVVYGGRAGGKDHNTVRTDLIKGMLYNPNYTEADIQQLIKLYCGGYDINPALLERCMRKPRRFLYCREVMESIKRSSYSTIKDTVNELGLEKWWIFRDDKIVCINGSEFFFAGLYRDPHNIKSIEGVTDCRVIEAENVSDESWKYLIPTIRKDGSETLVSFNTRYVDDPTYQRWVENPPKGTVVRKINSHDIEGYLSKEILRVRDDDYRLRRYEYDNIWAGEPLAAGRKLYPAFKEDVHVRHYDFKWLQQRANFFMASDPAQNHYPACVWCAVFPDDNGILCKYVYAEYPTFSDFNEYYHKVRRSMVFTGTVADLAESFIKQDGFTAAEIRSGLDLRKRFIDTRFTQGVGSGNFFSNNTRGLVGEFARCGIDFDEPDRDIIDAQREILRADLAYDPEKPIDAYNSPRLFIDPSCMNLIQSLKNHRLEDKSEKESEKYKDFIDALRICYAGMSINEYQDPNKPKVLLQYRNGRGNYGNGTKTCDSYMSL